MEVIYWTGGCGYDTREQWLWAAYARTGVCGQDMLGQVADLHATGLLLLETVEEVRERGTEKKQTNKNT